MATAEVEGNDAVVGQLPADERGRHVERVLLSRGRRPEPAAHGAAHREHLVELKAARDFAVGRRTEIIEVLEPDRCVDRPPAGRGAKLDITVDRNVVAAPGSCCRVGPVAVKAV